jgi:ethanolamine utilization protein EutN
MRIGHVIGRVTLNQQDPSLRGGRFLLVNPVDAAHLNSACATPPPLSSQPSIVVYDNIGAGPGDIIGFVEGGEATAAFDFPIPIEALNIALLDQIHHHPAA